MNQIKKTRKLSYIANKEKFVSKPYKDSAGFLTIGYGTRLKYYPELQQVKSIDETKAKQYLKKHIDKEVKSAITNYVKVPLDQNKFDALVSLIYNIGRKRFINSKLIDEINKMNDYGIRMEWLSFDRDRKGRQLSGLTKRRQEEYQLFDKFVK